MCHCCSSLVPSTQKKLHYSQSSRHQESHQFNSPCAAGQGLNANHPNTQPFVAGYKTSRAVQQKQIWDDVSPELPEVYCIFLHSQREGHERSHTLTSPHPSSLQQSMAAHLCHQKFWRQTPKEKAYEQTLFSI